MCAYVIFMNALVMLAHVYYANKASINLWRKHVSANPNMHSNEGLSTSTNREQRVFRKKVFIKPLFLLTASHSAKCRK